jgi:Flp pilus assembly pilin Flp
MTRIMSAISILIRDDGGQDLLEYGLVAVLIAIGAMLAVGSVGDTITRLWWGPIADQL